MRTEARKMVGAVGRARARIVARNAGLGLLLTLGMPLLISSLRAASVAGGIIGLPFTRTYSLDEIGEVTRGARLGFDRIGRLAVISDHSYVVLNDATWLDLAQKGPGSVALLQAANDAAGRTYFGALAAWGELEYTREGKLRTRSFRPREYPAWVNATNFYFVVPLEGGVLFGGPNGLVYWDRSTGEQTFMETPGVSNVFTLGGKVFVSSHSQNVQSFDVATHTLRRLDRRWDGFAVDRIADLGEGRALVFTTGRRLMIFDGETFTEWRSPLGARTSGRVSCLQRLVDGGVAVAIDGQGLYLFTDTGECRLALTTTEYHRINDLVTREAGVLWLVTEGTVQKLLYGNPVSVVDQRSGVSVSWPQLGYWNDTALIASHGDLYAMVSRPDGLSSRFERVSGQPGGGVWTMAAQGPHLLVGNALGVFAREGDTFIPVLSGIATTRLLMVSPEFCYVLGAAQLTAIRWNGTQWVECEARIPGVGFPAMVHAAGSSAWIELGANRAARVWMQDGALRSRVFDAFPWAEPSWINIGVVGNIVVLGGPDQQRLFFNEETGELCDAPGLQTVLAGAPYPISRVYEDRDGVLWAAHEQGVLTMHPEGSDYRANTTALKIVRDRHPALHLFSGGQVWISTGTALYHINRNFAEIAEAPLRPFLVSVTDGRSGQEVFSAAPASERVNRFSYAQNSLSLRFFAGGYSALRAPSYEFTMQARKNNWTIRSTDSLVALPNLPEGTYRLTAQLLNSGHPASAPVVTEFTIDPPWYRATWAYALYWASGVAASCGLIAWSVRRMRRKHAFLANLVHERTEELRSTMEKLREETRTTATLAERNRLAGEIHDSLQQGLSGLMLQLDATLKLPGLGADVRSRLTVARNMVSFTRHEVQQAVWDLESPLLENADLADALRKLTALITTGRPRMELQFSGTAAHLSSSTKHHLLRIAQEAITNAVRHGEAGQIRVRLECTPAATLLEVSDNGRGFIPHEVFSNGIGHFGLRGLKGRAAKINGDLQIISERGRGTTVRILLSSVHSPEPLHGAVAANR